MNSEKFDLSIIVPAYNAEKTIKRTLHSAVNSAADLNFEFIVINDGSTDYTKKYVEDFFKRFNHFSTNIINTRNNGLSAARNLGVEYAKGKYLSFLDSDDYFCERSLKKLVTFSKKNNCDIAFARAKIFNDREEILAPFYDDEIWKIIHGEHDKVVFQARKRPLIFATEPNACIKIWKKNFYINGQFKFPVGKYFEDFCVHAESLIEAKNIGSMNIVHLLYRQGREGSITTSKDKRRLDILDNLLKFLSFDKISDFDNEMGAHFLYSMIRITNWCYQNTPNEFQSEFELRFNKISEIIPRDWIKKYMNYYDVDNRRKAGFPQEVKRGLARR